MFRLGSRIAAWLLCFALAATVPAQFDDLLGEAGAGSSQHVHAELIANVTAIEPGKPLRLGVRFVIDPGWHIYWKNSGDVGYATSVEWNLPEGFTAGPLQWPAPERMEADSLISYGYEGSVILSSEIEPPETLEGPVELGARADWLMCRESCIPGGEDLTLSLPVGPGPASGDAPALMRAAARTPVSPEDSGLEIEFEPATLSVAPGETAQVTAAIAPQADLALAPQADAFGLFPLPGDAFESGLHAELTRLEGGGAEIRWPVKALARTEPGTYRLPAIITAAFADQGEVSVETALNVEVLGDQPSGIGTDATDVVNGSVAPESGATLSFLQDQPRPTRSVWAYLLLAFLGGMLLNVMPCVLPVISIKVMSFVNQAGQSRERVFKLGLVYAAGVLVSFAVLAAVVIGLKLAGSSVGWGFQLQNPVVVLTLSAVILAFALSLFGVFEIQLPGSAAEGADGLTRREGAAGAFFNGVLATVLATPCTAPMLGAALGFAFTQPPWLVMAFFLTVGAGLATPFVLLAANPGWMRILPKPGAWMDRFKQLMGFALLATLVWLLSVLGSLLGADSMTAALAFLTVVGFACWLAGGWSSYDAPLFKRRAAWPLAAVLIAAGYMVLPARHFENADGRPPQTQRPAHTEGEIEWRPFSVGLVEQLATEGRMVYLDFTADWCQTCQVNKKLALETERTRRAFEKYGVTPVLADWTARDETIRGVLAQFGRSGVPLNVILPAGQPGKPILLPELLTPGVVEEKLAEADRVSRGEAEN